MDDTIPMTKTTQTDDLLHRSNEEHQNYPKSNTTERTGTGTTMNMDTGGIERNHDTITDDVIATAVHSLEQEQDQRLMQLLQYIAIMNTSTSTNDRHTMEMAYTAAADTTDTSSSPSGGGSGGMVTSSTIPVVTRRGNHPSKKGTGTVGAATIIPTNQAISSSSSSSFSKMSTTSTTVSSFVQSILLPKSSTGRIPVPVLQKIPPYFYATIVSKSNVIPPHPHHETPDTIFSSTMMDDDSNHLNMYHHPNVIFTTTTFRECVIIPESLTSTTSTTPSVTQHKSLLPFTFYGSTSLSTATAATTTSASARSDVNVANVTSASTTFMTNTMLGKKRTRMETNPNGHGSTNPSHHCWLRLTRLSATTTTATTSMKHSSHNNNENLLRMKRILEPIYNRLFDYIQQDESQHCELLWGLGHAYYIIPSSTTSAATVINGPLLEVPMEMELGKKDGAIYLRPKQSPHASSASNGGGGVRINREVLTALLRHSNAALSKQQGNPNNSNNSTSGGTTDTLLQSWYRKVQNDIDIAQISPAQPETYRPILQQMAMELLSNGVFIDSTTATTVSSDVHHRHDPQKTCIISDTWCLYVSNKPSSILSRDALAFVDRISKKNTIRAADVPKIATLTNHDSRIRQESQTEFLPATTWAITHGPGSYERYRKQVDEIESRRRRQGNGFLQWIRSSLFPHTISSNMKSIPTNLPPKISLPLPSTDAQHRIVDMLLYQNYPCVVVEGPPGTGKSQTICNMICAYLRVGKRILVTSKNASSLSVIRKRLPKTIQELCIDVSNSEYNGVRQLQQTVERLSNRLANSTYQQQVQQQLSGSGGTQLSTNVGTYVDSEHEKLLHIQKLIEEHEQEVAKIDDTITDHYKQMYQLLQSTDGKQYMNIAIELLQTMPWLMSTIATWTPYAVMKLRDQIEAFVLQQSNDPIERVCSYPNPPSNALISLAASNADMKIHVASNVTKKAVASIPFVGSWIGMDQHNANLDREISMIRIGDHVPTSPSDWSIVVRALRRAQAMYSYGQGAWKTYEHTDLWPKAIDFFANHDNIRDLHSNLCKAVEMKNLGWKLNIYDRIAASANCQSLDSKRCTLSKQIHALSEELVNLTVVTELCRSLSEEALSALIRFSQIAGKAKFHKPNIPVAKMSQRQRRHRDDYLDAFDQCCRYIPCWILTTSQISDFLPPEPLFDLVIIDETSQSDITVLPTMLRGKQWLIVGDGKQVSPTETFISEEQMEHLRAIIPQCYFESALLPGQSFFDLCAQAFPTSRVVLNEHFRCASEIIEFSNENFYDNQLIPLRLPTQSERITPSIIDVRLPKGIKVGKINEREVDEIVRRVAEIVESHEHGSQHHRRSIGIISLMGDEQSRLIRGRLLDTIGPQRMAQHSVLVGDPPSFQGTERDSRAPTQSQLVHFQRSNVAMSRARDQCILVRSLDISDVPSSDDVKIPIIEFFQKAMTSHENSSYTDNADVPEIDTPFISSKNALRQLLVVRLIEQGYKICRMGVVWNDGICVEHPECDERVALIIDDVSKTYQDWVRSYRQQQKIEGVGWKCVRVDVLSFLSDCTGTMQSVFEFLKQAGICNDEKTNKGIDAVTVEEMQTQQTQNHDIVEEEVRTSSSFNDSIGIAVVQSVKNSQESVIEENSLARNATRATKRSRTNRNNKVKQHVDLSDIAEAEVESLISTDSQSNSNDGNVVVDLSFLRGR